MNLEEIEEGSNGAVRRFLHMTGKFYFDGVPSESLGVYIVNIGSSDDNMPLFGGHSLTQQDVIEHDYSTFIRTKKENLRLTMHFTLIDPNGISENEAFTPARINSIAKYIARSVPVELMVEEDKAKVINVVPTSSIDVVRFGEMKGFFQISYQATTPYWMTPMDVLTFNLTAGQSFDVVNRRNIQDKYGNYDVYPKIVIRNMMECENFILSNSAPRGREVGFKWIVHNESIEMHHRIVTAAINQRIFHNWNKQPFLLVENLNTFTVNSACTIDLHVQYPIF